MELRTDVEEVTMQPGDQLVVNDAGIMLLARPGAPVREVVGGRYEMGQPGRVTIKRPGQPNLLPDQRDALTALRDTVASDAESMVMQNDGTARAIGEYAGQIRSALDRALGPRNP